MKSISIPNRFGLPPTYNIPIYIVFFDEKVNRYIIPTNLYDNKL